MPRDYRLQVDDILEAIARVREYTAQMSEETFASDHKTQDAVIRNLEIIGEAARNLPEDIKSFRRSHRMAQDNRVSQCSYSRVLWDQCEDSVGCHNE